MKKLVVFGCLLIGQITFIKAQNTAAFNILFTSDVHYGLSKEHFRGDTGVASAMVNMAMISQMNKLVKQQLPQDNGVSSGQVTGNIPYLVITGDIANREEPPYQRSAASWQQFSAAYDSKLLTAKGNQAPQMFLVPGNHDVSNAIGFTKTMVPATDPTSYVQIYNRMMRPAKPLTNQAFNFAADKINYSRDVKGLHLVFVTIWPDSAERMWMEQDLKKVPAATPVIIFAHDPPDGDPKHFSNPAAPGQFTAKNKFENLVAEVYKENTEPKKGDDATDIEQRGFVSFLKRHPNIKAYFHGHNNWTDFYTYHGPDKDVNLPTFRVDSPMKGKYSAKDETKLSFQLISIDPVKKMLTVRECLWNTKPGDTQQPIVFGDSKTINL